MDNPAKSATAVKDPVCGMTVDPASARYRLEHAGKTHYFCSNHCVEKFKADSEKYLNQPAQFGSPSLVMLGGQPASTHAPAGAKVAETQVAASPAKRNYVCAMCPEVRESK